MRSLRWRTRTAAVIGVLLALAGQAQGGLYYNVVSVESEQLSNAVRIKITADGAITANIAPWWQGGDEENYYVDWALVEKQTKAKWTPECYQRVNGIKLRLHNAQAQVGSVVHVGKYPVSNVELASLTKANGQPALDVDVVLQKPMRYRYFNLTTFETDDAYLEHADPECFEVVQSLDRRSIIVTVACDTLPDPPEHLSLSDIPENERELSVRMRDGLLDIHARNVDLPQLIEAVSRASGKPIMVDTATHRVVSVEFPYIVPDDFVSAIAGGYGLSVSGTRDCPVLGDIIAQTTSAYTSGESEHIQLSWIKARQALALLPNFLLDYVRVDEQQNALVVAGSHELAEKIRQDLRVIDQPQRMVSLQAVILESADTKDADIGALFDRKGDKTRITTDSSLGEITFARSTALTEELKANIDALVTQNKARVVANPRLVVLSGEQAELFAGLDKYIQFKRKPKDTKPTIDAVSAGVKLTITPWAGERSVTMSVATEVTDISEVDTKTNLPTLDTRNVQGTLQIQSGETIVIGGLTQKQSHRTVRRVPILGHIPLIGRLFTKTITRDAESEIAVLVTPVILETGEQLDDHAEPLIPEIEQ